jgi:hypothetical protein
MPTPPARTHSSDRTQVAGYPTHPGQSLALERVDSGQRYVLRSAQDPGEYGAFERFEVPVAWHGAAVRLVAQDASTEFEGWAWPICGLSPIDLMEGFPSNEHLRAIFAILGFFVLWLLPGAVVATYGLGRFRLDARAAFPSALVPHFDGPPGTPNARYDEHRRFRQLPAHRRADSGPSTCLGVRQDGASLVDSSSQ